jgi:hypothetical protein
MVLTADAHNWVHATGLPDYLYDAAGNMTHDATAGLDYTFDQENRITGAGGYTYTYDADGNRVKKSNGTGASAGTLYWYMTPGIVAESDQAGTLKRGFPRLRSGFRPRTPASLTRAKPAQLWRRARSPPRPGRAYWSFLLLL